MFRESSWGFGASFKKPRRFPGTSPTFLRLTEATGDVALGAFVVGIGEDVVGSPNSTSSPRRKKPVLWEIRVACCILWVTMTMVVDLHSSVQSSSILPVEMGSRALVGSSMSRMPGLTARARAMQSRCC